MSSWAHDIGAVGSAVATAQCPDDPAAHTMLINAFAAANIDRQERREPSSLGIGKPKEIRHLVTSSTENLNDFQIKLEGRVLSLHHKKL